MGQMRDWILIVDDDEAIRESLSMIMEIHGFACKTASNGKRALELLYEECKVKPPSLVFMDLWMPVMDGISFLKTREHDVQLYALPTFLFSADGAIQAVADKLHATGYLQKPVELDEILKVANTFCRVAA